MQRETSVPVVVWFRQDLRLEDNPALFEASKLGLIIPIYIMDDINASQDKMGSASRLWLYHSLDSLNRSLDGHLKFFCGDAFELLPNIMENSGARSVFWNRCYEPWRIARDARLKRHLIQAGFEVYSTNGSLLWEPWEISKKDGSAYKVFTPFYKRGCLSAESPRKPLPVVKNILLSPADIESNELDELGLLPKNEWHRSVKTCWDISEKAASEQLEVFIQNGLTDYMERRNFPAKQGVSRLSPYLHFGQISPHKVWHRVECEVDRTSKDLNQNIEHFFRELGWREFSYYLLYHSPDLPNRNLQPRFDEFPWVKVSPHLEAWQRGLTGYPLIDAGMRELWQTGYMHNRVRMVVASFLVKNLLVHWKCGADWFWDCLVDADLASNSASWQWVAGSGADAAPFFRIFNPITQSEKFDSEGRYILSYVPELRNLPKRYLHSPWLAPTSVLDAAGITLGIDYPNPIVDIKSSRSRALNAFNEQRTRMERA